MFKFLSRLIRRSKPVGTPGQQDLANKPSIQEQVSSKSDESHKVSGSIEDLWAGIAHLSSPTNRFLSPQYSPKSRVPCADFTGFVIDRLRNNDLISIKQLMRAIITHNPGLGTGNGWIERSVDQIAEMDFSRYLKSDDQDFVLELKSLFIIRSKEGGGRGFWLADYSPLLFSYALCCHRILWLDSLSELKDKATKFIKTMKEDSPFWRTYKLPEQITTHKISEVESSVISNLGLLPLLTRMHLMSFVEKGTTSLMHSTSFSMRTLGLNPLQTAPIILASGICKQVVERESLLSILSRSDLITALAERNIPFEQSSGKAELLNVLGSKAPDVLQRAAEREEIVSIKDEFLPQLRSLLSYANSLEAPLSFLCFAS